MMTKE